MNLFVSDMHFGRGTRAETRADEAALIACLERFEGEVEHLYLVGDVFDEFIEYRRLVPKGCARFLGLLARLTDRGIGVTYAVGNHDPWHVNYFASELGVRVLREALVERTAYGTLHLEHGDDTSRPLSRLLRHPVPVWLYRALLPGDFGMWLASRVNRSTTKDGPDPRTVRALGDRARRILAGGAADLVVMGHSHEAELRRFPEGVYLNVGAWHGCRTFGAQDAGGVRLLHWNGNRSETVARSA